MPIIKSRTATQVTLPASPDISKTTYATPALDKGLDVLELLAHESVGLTKSEIARRLGRTVSEIFRMLLCLERRGFIAQTPDDRYQLTLKLFKLAQEHPPTERLMSEALPVMHWLARHAQQSCHLAVLDGALITILSQVNASNNSGFYVKPGSTVDLMSASSGHVILAHQNDDVRERILGEWQTESGKAPPSDLHKHLANIRKRGFEVHASYQVIGIINLSFPIFDERGIAISALTVPYIKRTEGDIGIAKIEEFLREAAQKITHAIGGVFPEHSEIASVKIGKKKR